MASVPDAEAQANMSPHSSPTEEADKRSAPVGLFDKIG